MNRLQRIAMVAVVAFVTLGAAGCILVDDDATITCDNLDAWLASCDPGCYVPSDCESFFDVSADPGFLMDCSDCLALESGSCLDCDLDGYSCLDELSYELGVACDY